MKLQLSKKFVANIRYSKLICKFISNFITPFRKKSLCWGKIIEILLNRDFVFSIFKPRKFSIFLPFVPRLLGRSSRHGIASLPG